ncbi:hypothetical protein [Streptomyces sp. NBC_00102]|uniref:hypothetical protein n=1 Tax=Streptomyces sp. NBC_00102 TaxID=2975652 RepID=UPI002255BB3D|nr:hypothetical protein [Streptomyces sp. NBC_00102]MCX5398084.1 hypothetical protein [Streptomyces sp. NBC_00102]
MSGTETGEDLGMRAVRARALALLRIRSRAVALAILPAAVAVVMIAATAQGRLSGVGWNTARWVVGLTAVVFLLLAAGVAVTVARARPALSPTVAVDEKSAPDLYRLVRELADRMGVPAPSAIALTPDCDSWLEDRTHPTARTGPAAAAKERADERRDRERAAPVLVIGSPFLWWMRVGELRAVLAPVVAGTRLAAHPDIAAARRFVRGLDGVVADAGAPGPARSNVSLPGLFGRPSRAFTGWAARLLLRSCRGHAAEMERCVALSASLRAQGVDYGVRAVAQEQVGLVYAGWDRLLTRVALPAWRMGRWPARLDAGVVSALTELSRRDRLAEGFAARLGERPACDLLEEPGLADEAASLLAARLFHGGPARGGEWSPVDWQQYPEEVVDRKWRAEAARLHGVMDSLGTAAPGRAPGSSSPAGVPEEVPDPARSGPRTGPHASPPEASPPAVRTADAGAPTLARVIDHLAARGGGEELAAAVGAAVAREEAAEATARAGNPGTGTHGTGTPAAAGTATGTAAGTATGAAGGNGPVVDPLDLWGPGPLPLFPLQPPRTGAELLADHVTAMVCCAAVDTAGAAPGLDWLDGPALLVDGARRTDLGTPVLSLVEDGDAEPLRTWLSELGIREDKPVRLV